MGSLRYLTFFLLSFLQLSSVVNGGNFSRSSFTPIKRDLYHSSDSLMKEVKALVGRHPDRLTMETLSAGNKGYSADILVVTYHDVKKDIADSLKFRILLSFGQHGRELITSEAALRLLCILSEEYTIPNMDPISMNNILEKLVIKVVPMENLNGRKLVESGDLCERRNGRGVDLNRNWSVDWGKKEKDYDPYEENPGSAPFSEPETQIMRKLTQSFSPHVWVNVHSGMEAMFMPYDHRNTTPDGFASHIMRSMLEDLNHRACQDRCLVGSGGGSVGFVLSSQPVFSYSIDVSAYDAQIHYGCNRECHGYNMDTDFTNKNMIHCRSVEVSGYLAHGTSTDYMYDIAKVPMSFTFEIFGDSKASSKDCFKMFNPIDLATFNRVINNWCAAFFTIFETGPHWLDKISSEVLSESVKWVSIDSYEDENLAGGKKKGKTMEVLDFGMQELRTYFRLFLVSSVLLLFMFCSRIAKAKSKLLTNTSL